MDINHKEVVNEYIENVLSGKIIAGRLVKLAVRRQVDDLKNGGSRGFYFDEDIAWDACDFFPKVLRHSADEWAGKPFILSDNQTFITWTLMGWRRTDTKMRRFRKGYVSCARKWGKTEWCAGMSHLSLAADDPIAMGAENYVAATKEKQAAKMHREAIAMAEQSPSLMKIMVINKNNIAVPRYRSFFQPLGSDSKTNAGWNPHWIFLDELCDWQEHHRDLWGALTTGSGARSQPMRLVICTAGDDSSDIWQKEDDYAVKILESVITGDIIDDEYFAYIARIDDERSCEDCDGTDKGCRVCGGTGMLPPDDPLDEKVWIKAQPNLDITVPKAYYIGEANQAKHKPEALYDFTRYQCNRKVTSSVKAITPEAWSRCDGELSDWSGKESYGAFDLGWESDLSSITIVCKVDETDDEEGTSVGIFEARSWSFICEETERDLNREPFATFIRLGLLTVTPGSTTDVMGTVVPRIVEVSDQYNVVQWAFDPSNARAVSNVLEVEHGMQVFKFTQSHGMYNESLRCFLKAVRDKTLRHGGDPLLAWCASNLVISKEKGAQDRWMPDKKKSREKIDPIVAMIMAFGGAMNSDVSSGYWNPKIGV